MSQAPHQDARLAMHRPHGEILVRSVAETLVEFGIEVRGAEAERAFGRLAALELASHLGDRSARRALHRERTALLGACRGSAGASG